jgi:hypothetical protein
VSANAKSRTLPRGRPRTTRDLTTAQRQLLQIMRENQSGRIEDMPVQAGQPLPDKAARVVRVAPLGGGENCGTKVPSDDYELKKAVSDLFDELERLDNGTVVMLKFKHGLPLLLETSATAMADRPGGAAPPERSEG